MKLRLENIEKNYDRPVIKNLSYCFESGKIYVIKGVSGCGKSTLFNIIGGLERNFSGSIYIDDEVRNKESKDNVGYVFQQSLLLSGMSVLDNLLLVRNDVNKVMNLSRQIGIEKLLDKFPEQISGGERQRAAIVRALLAEPDIFLADEPTASLDKTNSKITAGIISALKSDNRIVIVATHEKYFDELADEIIYLKYGTIERIEKNNPSDFNNVKKHTDEEKIQLKPAKTGSIKYNLKRNKKMFHPVSLLPFIVMFLVILMASTIQNSFSEEYIRDSVKKYPMDAFNITEYELGCFQHPDKLERYDYYVEEEDGVTALYLSEKPDSVLSIDGMIQYGQFPDSDDEILVSYEYAVSRFGENDLEKHVGEEITFCSRKFVISGIVYSLDEKVMADGKNPSFEEFYESDIYYMDTEGSIIYIPYNNLKEFAGLSVKKYGSVQFWRMYYRNLFDDEVMLNDARNSLINCINIFEQKIKYSQEILNGIMLILSVVFLVCFIIACIFMNSQIQIELFYRRKELGFLQIFGLKKKRVRRLVCIGYLMRIVLSFIFAAIIYAISVGLYNLICKSTLMFNCIHIAVIIAVLFVFYFITVLVSTNKFLRKDVIKLIVE